MSLETVDAVVTGGVRSTETVLRLGAAGTEVETSVDGNEGDGTPVVGRLGAAGDGDPVRLVRPDGAGLCCRAGRSDERDGAGVRTVLNADGAVCGASACGREPCPGASW